ncbi:interleukin-17F [Bombina bombina]|uniref:interleukin-17F n=1 Tax=Bombina bombina TaxID=8345 RepID=UPI00235AE09E|nr:interleukin-17F [Bombina bombina]
MFVALSTSAYVPEGLSSYQMHHEQNTERDFPTDTKERCSPRRSRRLPSSMSVDISAIDTSYQDSLLNMGGTERRSLSPWDYSLTVDPDRFPDIIAEANCLSSVCTDSNGEQVPDLISSPIQHEIMVLRREWKDCDYIYRLKNQLVIVGCTCTRAAVSEDWSLLDLH